MNVLPIYSEDNVGDSLSKINYNFLVLDSENCTIQENKTENDLFLDTLEKLMDDLDDLIPKIEYDNLEKLESTVLLLSSYWDNFEFTVQYPFNPTNGYTSTLVAAGELGDLNYSTDINDQISILSNALLTRKLYNNTEDAANGVKNNDLIYVKRDSDGNYVSWEYITPLNVLDFSVDIESNFYYNKELVDVYALPHFSVIIPSNLSLAQEGISVDFDTKIIGLNGVAQKPNYGKNGLSESSLVIYSVSTKEELDELGDLLDVTRFSPNIKKLGEYIPFYNEFHKQNLIKNKDTYLESSLSNPKLNKICLDFLEKDYPSSKYTDNTVVNVVFFLYNTNGGYNKYSATVDTRFFTNPSVTVSDRKLEFFKSRTGPLKLKAPSTNTDFYITFSKEHTYIEKMVVVRYVKKTRTVFVPVVNSDIPKIKQEPYWEFISANLGTPYQKGTVEYNGNLQKAPIYVDPSKAIASSLPSNSSLLSTEDDVVLQTKSQNSFVLK